MGILVLAVFYASKIQQEIRHGKFRAETMKGDFLPEDKVWRASEISALADPVSCKEVPAELQTVRTRLFAVLIYDKNSSKKDIARYSAKIIEDFADLRGVEVESSALVETPEGPAITICYR